MAKNHEVLGRDIIEAGSSCSSRMRIRSLQRSSSTGLFAKVFQNKVGDGILQYKVLANPQ